MDDTLLSILIAAAATLAFYGLAQLFTGGPERHKRKLAARLSSEGRGEAYGNADGPAEGRSIVRQTAVVGLPPALAAHPIVQALNRRLIQAYPKLPMSRFLAFVGSLGLFGTVIAFAFGASGPVSLGIGGLFGYIPFFLLGHKRDKRQQKIAAQLPEALDFLSRILKAGHSFSTGLQMMGDELPAPLSEEFRRCYDQHSLGQSLEDALKDTVTRIDSTDFAFFVTALLIQRQTGGDLSEVLKNISGMIRGRIRLSQQVKSKTAEGRFTGYILVAFPAIMFGLCYSQNPLYCGKLLTGTGLYFLGTAFGLQMLGLFFIKKITTIKV